MAEGPGTQEQDRQRAALARTRLTQALLKPGWVLLGIYTGIAALATIILIYSGYDWRSSVWFVWWVWSGSFAAVLTAVLGVTHLLINRFVDHLGLREPDEPPAIDHYS